MGFQTETLLEIARQLAPWQSFLVTAAWFALLYFGAAGLGLLLTGRLLPALSLGRVIDPRPLVQHQLRNEIARSLVSIAIFGGFGVATIEVVVRGWLDVTWHGSWGRIAFDWLLILFWNDLHFFLCHRLLHVPWLFQRFHLDHHRSKVPTPFSTYSFHWVEAVLLGSVMLTGMLLWDFHVSAILALPVMSITLNVLGHMNYDPFPAALSSRLRVMTRRHSAHHTRVHGNYGFLLPWFDMLAGCYLDDPQVEAT